MAGATTKWESISKKDFYDNAFNDWMAVTKAYSAFQHSSCPLTEDSYRAQSAILNALLTYHLDFSSAKYVDTKIEVYMRQFDNLIARSGALEKTNSLEELQRLVKCLLYFRIGDYLMGWIRFTKKDSEERPKQLTLALCAYALALEHALKGGLPLSGRKLLDSSKAICIMELHLLISKNLGKIVHIEDLMMTMSNQKLLSLLLKRINSSVQSGVSPSADASFITSDVSHRVQDGWQFPTLDIDKLLPIMWGMRCSTSHFLRRLIWIMNQEEICEFDHYPFLDEQIGRIMAKYPESLDEPCCPENMKLMDIKIFLFRISKVVALSAEPSECIVFPWPFYPKPSAQQIHVWGGIIALCSEQKLELSQTIALTNSIEQIRLQATIPSDKVNLAQTMTYLESVSNELPDKNAQNIYFELAERYASAVLLAIDCAQSSSKMGNFQTKSLFPPTKSTSSVVLDDELADLANVFIGKRLYHAKCYRAAEEKLLEVTQIYDIQAGDNHQNPEEKENRTTMQLQNGATLRPTYKKVGRFPKPLTLFSNWAQI